MQGVGRVAGGGGVATQAGRGGGRGGGGFSVGAAGGHAAARAAGAAAAVAPLALGMLALQERGGGDPDRDAAARRRADSLLDELRALQAELLAGGADPGRLARLAALESGEEGADPGLREVVQAVALRARVELARRGWDVSESSA